MEARIVLLEGGPFDGRTWDVTVFAFQAELTDDMGRSATYVETSRVSDDGTPIWTVEIE